MVSTSKKNFPPTRDKASGQEKGSKSNMSEEDVEFTVEHEFQKAEADGKAFPRKNPTHGLGLVTGESIKVGEDVALIRKPLVAVLDSVRLGDTCTNCFGKRTANALSDEKVKLKRCTGCDKVRYCDKVGLFL